MPKNAGAGNPDLPGCGLTAALSVIVLLAVTALAVATGLGWALAGGATVVGLVVGMAWAARKRVAR